MKMKTERKISIAKAIIEKAIEVSDTTKHDVFVELCPHVQWLEAVIFINGWEIGKYEDKRFRISFDSYYADPEKEFKVCMAYMNELLAEAKE